MEWGGAVFRFNGTDWERLNSLGNLPTLNSVSFTDNSDGIAVGHAGTILIFTPDGDWEKEISPVKVRLNGTSIAGNTYYAVGTNGTILSSKKLFTSSREDADPAVIRNELKTCPNPANGLLNVVLPSHESFSISSISIIDYKGNIEYRAKMPSPSAEGIFQINVSGLRSGLYVIHILSSGGKSSTGRFVVKH